MLKSDGREILNIYFLYNSRSLACMMKTLQFIKNQQSRVLARVHHVVSIVVCRAEAG